MERRRHFLVVTHSAHGHINPALHLARRLARIPGTLVTFSTSGSGRRRMFPSSAAPPDQEIHDGLLSHIPFSDGTQDGYASGTNAPAEFMSRLKQLGSPTFSAVVAGLAARGRPVTCIAYNFLLPWASDVARDHGVPAVLFWIQPATVFSIYYHYFHGYDGIVAAHRDDPSFSVRLPGLPPLNIRDLPSFLTSTHPDDPYSCILATLRETFEGLEREGTKPNKVLVNTFEALEPDALAGVNEQELIAVGPLVPDGGGEGEQCRYIEWLDSKQEGSVVYVSFGTITALKRRQVEEIARGLSESGRPYLWSIRKDGTTLCEAEEGGLVVEWCSQTRVLSHPAVGCFVTHCGWNSTLESLTCGLPTVGVPQWSDQATNARLAEEEWGTGVRAEVDGEGFLEGRELRRCLELVMGDGERGEEIRRRAEMWRDTARKAAKEGGSSDRNLKAFVENASRI